MTSPWWAAFGPAETTISCGDGKHRLRWAEGTMQPVDHPDAEGELVLAVLGGDTTPCLDLTRAWSAASDDLGALAIGPRSATDTLTIKPADPDEFAFPGRLVRGWGGAQPTAVLLHGRRRLPSWARASAAWHGGQEDETARAGLLRLLSLGPPFQFRLSGAVAHAWSADGQHAAGNERARPALTAALSSRFAAAAAQWLGIDPERVEVSVHHGPGWGDIDSAGMAGARRLRASLPVSWLARVWAPGLALIGGHLVVSTQRAEWPNARVLAIRAPGDAPIELGVRQGQRGWTITP
jgi:hypothetical protein